MTNHVHLVVVPEREDSLARALSRVHSEYALAFNSARGGSGHLWQSRFFSCPLDESYLIAALRYTDLNPVRTLFSPFSPEARPYPWRPPAIDRWFSTVSVRVPQPSS
jgi:putative transposase